MNDIRILVYALVSVMLGCTDDSDPPWQLDHDRIIAVRATPPRIAAGDQAVVDMLVGFKGAPIAERPPAARSELGLPAGAPVPLKVRAGDAGHGLFALKTVWLGDSGTGAS